MIVWFLNFKYLFESRGWIYEQPTMRKIALKGLCTLILDIDKS
jgi:hypothetical protein